MTSSPRRSDPGENGPEVYPESPRHGDQGDRAPAARPAPFAARSLTIALSREAGARGGTISQRVGRKLGWGVYTQEMLEYIAQEEAHIENILESLPPAGTAWVSARLEALLREQRVSQHPSVRSLARAVLALGVQGEAVLVGRGAGFLLPPASTLHVRVVAPLADRIAYMSQWLRLTLDEAAELVELRDRKRGEFIAMHFHRQPNDIYQYDLLLNSSLLGEDLCVELIVQAARAKLASRTTGTGDRE
jgi:cytidylate kinase